jgi:AraC-like DNA-binding protein
MVVNIEHHSFQNFDPFSIISNVQQIYKQIDTILKSFDGNIVQQNEDGCLISFRTVTAAVSCAIKIYENYRIFRTQYQTDFTELSIGLHAGIPVTDKKSIFEDTIKLAQRMCFISIAEVVITVEVQHLFESENVGEVLNSPHIHVLTPMEEKFLNGLMDFTEKEWQNEEIKVEDFEKNIGISKSKFYREMIRLTGKSPNVFLLYFRLRKSLQLLLKQKGTISEVAFDSGFNSPSYYSRCFRKKYGIIPSELIQQ